MIFYGTYCKEGYGKAIVLEIGQKTVLGQIADLAQTSETEKTPLKGEMDRFVIIITIIAISLGIIFFFSAKFAIGYSWIDSMIFGIGILVCNVPEGLLGCITISLVISAKNLASKQILVKNLIGVDTLGSASCICTDKTGTLTQNKMIVKHLWYDLKNFQGQNKQKFGDNFNYEYDVNNTTFKELQRCAVTCSEAIFQTTPENYDKVVWLDEETVKGDATESALIKFFQPLEDILITRKKFPIHINESNQKHAKIPFQSTYKFMLNIQKEETDDSNFTVYLKGAPEKIWSLCNKIQISQKNDNEQQTQIIDDIIFNQYQKIYNEYAKNGQRVLGFAKLSLNKQKYYKNYTFELNSPDNINFELNNCTFLGLISLQDPPKDTVKKAIQKCNQAGIKIIMITGDFPQTAAAISKQVNIIPQNVKTNLDILEESSNNLDKKITWQDAIKQSDAVIIHGDQITDSILNDNQNFEIEQKKKLKEIKDNPHKKQEKYDFYLQPQDIDTTLQTWISKKYCVFARTTPIQKLKIVQTCQKMGHIVAVTGDGVNDSPAIKQSDIGISMGINGSDISKDVADMIILNDDFSSIVDGIEEGRKIYDNLKKTIVYLLTSNVAQIIPFSSQLLFLLPLPLNNMLMLIICIGTDIVPALGLAYELPENDIMTRQPRERNDHLISSRLMIHSYFQTGWIACAGGFFGYFTTLYYYGFQMNGLFGLQSNKLLTSVRGLKIHSNAFDYNSYYLGNEYLQNNYAQNIVNNEQKELFTNCAYTMNILKNKNNNNKLNDIFKTELLPAYYPNDIPEFLQKYTQNQDNKKRIIDYLGIDWYYQNDHLYDLRYIIVECNIQDEDSYEKYSDSKYNNTYETRWIPKIGTFKECQHKGEESVQMNFQEMQTNSGDQLQLSVIKDIYIDSNGKEVGIPICYNTEALKYAQTSYFIGIVIVQISNILAVKANKASLFQTKWNSMIFLGILIELCIAIFLCYTPEVQKVFVSRDINIYQWCSGCIFSIILFIWSEIRKYLIRIVPQYGRTNFFEKNIHW